MLITLHSLPELVSYDTSALNLSLIRPRCLGFARTLALPLEYPRLIDTHVVVRRDHLKNDFSGRAIILLAIHTLDSLTLISTESAYCN